MSVCIIIIFWFCCVLYLCVQPFWHSLCMVGGGDLEVSKHVT